MSETSDRRIAKMAAVKNVDAIPYFDFIGETICRLSECRAVIANKSASNQQQGVIFVVDAR